MGLLSTSGIIVIVCVLAGIYFVSRRQPTAHTGGAFGAERFAEDVMDDSLVDDVAPQIQSAPVPSTAGVPRVFEALPVGRPWARLAVFGASSLALGLALVLAFVALFTSMSWWAPALLAVLGTAGLTALRVLALRDRDRRRAEVEKALEEQKVKATYVAPAKVRVEAPDVHLKESRLLSDTARRQLPVNHAVKSLRKARTSHQPGRHLEGTASYTTPKVAAPVPAEKFAEDRSWQPVSVPRPTYLDAQAAHRDIPEPVVAEQTPKANSETLSQAATINLDDVLKRRRA